MTTPPRDKLDEFVDLARRHVGRGYYDEIPADAPRRVGPSLLASLEAPGKLPVIAEIKPKSPTAGTLRASPDPAVLAPGFFNAGARGVSILTEPERFGGSLRNVVRARNASALPVPILFKDFVVADAQLDAAAACGASAVLLILPVLERGAAAWSPRDAVHAAHTRGLEVLLEVYTMEEYGRAARLGADMLGINNRDLRDLTIDPARAATVLANGKLAPTLALSAAETRDDVTRQIQAGADGVLIGSALMRAPDPVKKLEELIT